MSREFGICGASATATTSGGSPWAFPAQPFPVNNDGFVSNTGNIIPHNGTLVNQVTIPVAFSTTSSGDLRGLLNNSLVWSVNATDINAAADGFLGTYSFHYDNVNDRLYVFAVDTGTAPDTYYTAYITLETGAVTNVGNVQVTTDPSNPTVQGHLTVGRAAVDSGDFTLTFDNRTIVLDETNGSEVSNDASTNISESQGIGSYVSLDGTDFMDQMVNGTANASYMIMTRSGNSVFLSMPEAIFANSTSVTLRAISWGDKVKFIDVGGAANERLTRTFLRTEFDAWLVLVGNFGGLV